MNNAARIWNPLTQQPLTEPADLISVPPHRFHHLREALLATRGHDFYARWARWFFIERLQEDPPDPPVVLPNEG